MKRLFSLFLLLFVSHQLVAQEICDNGIDDDTNGLVDLNDPACVCSGFGNTITSAVNYIPNPSFEDFTCCPSGYSQFNCLNTWTQGSSPTTDYWNMCGSTGSTADELPEFPIPNGNGFVGFINMAGWQEYLSVCLDQPLSSDTIYELSFYLGHSVNSPELELAVFGTPNCNDIPFSGNDCPDGLGDWVQIGSTMVGDSAGWVQYSITLTPTTIMRGIAIGAVCSSGGSRAYYYLDDLNISILEPNYPINVVSTGLYCNHDAILESSIDTSGGAWQWYLEGVALLSENDDSLNISANGYALGIYSSTYTIGGGCQVAEHILTPPDTVNADFLTDSVCLGELSHFIDLSSSDSLGSWDWSFGDGGTSDLQNPVYVYPHYGTYEVIFKPTSPTGCTDTAIAYAVVYPLPEVGFDWVAECGSYEFEFTDLSTISGLATNSEWIWSFGDGDSSNINDPVHQFDSLGVYHVSLQVTSSDGCTNQITYPVQVQLAPEADFTFTEVCLGYTTNFHDFSLPFGGPLVSWSWNYGNGAFSIEENPVYTYPDTGAYQVTLSITDVNGCADTLTQIVEVFLCASILEADDVDFISIYPNPASELVSVHSERDAIKAVDLFDAAGKLVLSSTHDQRISTSVSILLNGLASGFYHLVVSIDGGIPVYQRLIVE